MKKEYSPIPFGGSDLDVITLQKCFLHLSSHDTLLSDFLVSAKYFVRSFSKKVNFVKLHPYKKKLK